MDKKQRKKQIRKYILWICLVLTVLLLAVMPLLASRRSEADGPQASILTAAAEQRDIATHLIGGGLISSKTTEDVAIPAQIKLTKYLVGNGDNVKKGDPIARVDKVSVMIALQEVQETLDYLAEELADVSNDTEPKEVKAQAGGLVKIVHGQVGDDVREVMLEHGALAVLSLDGRMAVDIPLETSLMVGDSVTVTLTEGTEVDGRVESAVSGTLTVSIEDEDYEIGETVVVSDEDGSQLGSGELYIHSPWNATAYHGTITQVKAIQNTQVSAGRTLFQLETSGHSAQFEILNEQRRDYEELMQELFVMYDSGVITAPCDGFVTGVDEDAAYLLAADSEEQTWFVQPLNNVTADDAPGWTVMLLNNEEPGGDEPEGGEGGSGNDGEGDNDDDTEGDEGGSEGGEGGSEGGEGGDDGTGEGDKEPTTGCDKTEDCPAADSEHDPECPKYKDPEATPSANVFQVEAVTDNGVTLKYISGDNAYKPTSFPGKTYPDNTPIAAGDLVTLTPEGVITKIGTAGTQAPGVQQQPQIDMSGLMGAMGGMMGGMAGFGGMGTTQTFQVYSLEEMTIATVTSQEQMSLEITVDEQDISRLYLGQEATITVEALTGQTFPATITTISNTGTNSGGSSKFAVTLTLGISGEMLPNMNASAYIDLDTEESVLTVPVAALMEEGTSIFLYTSYSEKDDLLGDPVAVTTGVSDGEYVQILSGIEEGTTVYYPYYDTVEESAVPERGLGF